GSERRRRRRPGPAPSWRERAPAPASAPHTAAPERRQGLEGSGICVVYRSSYYTTLYIIAFIIAKPAETSNFFSHHWCQFPAGSTVFPNVPLQEGSGYAIIHFLGQQKGGPLWKSPASRLRP